MPTLTPDQIAAARAQSGDTVSPYDVTDTQMQAIFDDPAAAAGDPDRLIVFILRRRIGRAANLIAVGGDGLDAAYQQRFAQLRALLAYWESLTGLDGGRLTSGGIALRLDEQESAP
jgi:hypothetical protein